MLRCAGVQGQCGGNALSCGKGYTTPCISAPWPTAVCRSSGWTCNRYGELPYSMLQHPCCQLASAHQLPALLCMVCKIHAWTCDDCSSAASVCPLRRICCAH